MTTKPATHQIISTSRVDEPPPSPGSGDVWQVLVWRAYQVLHPRAGDEPTARDGKLITWCLAELHRTRLLTPEACGELLIDLLRCFHLAPETAFWRGGDGKARLGIGTLCKREKFGDRVETTLAWVEGGRPEQEAQPDYASAERAKKAIGWVWSRIDSGSTGFPEGMTAKIGEAGARAYAAGIEAIGGWDHASRTPAARRAGPTAAFTAAFIASLQGDTDAERAVVAGLQEARPGRLVIPASSVADALEAMLAACTA